MRIGIFCSTHFINLGVLIRLLGTAWSNEGTYRHMEVYQSPIVYTAAIVTISNVTHHVY